MTNPTSGLDNVPVYGFFFVDEQTPDSGDVFLEVTQRLTRVDGRRIYAEGATTKRTIGDADTDAATRDAVRAAWRAADQAAQGTSFDGGAWDAWWAVQLNGAVFASFPAMDDPDIVHDPANPYQVKVTEILKSGGGRTYSIQVQLSDLSKTPPGVNLGLVAVPPNSAYNPAPIYQKGVIGGVAALDTDGDVLNAAGHKVGSLSTTLTAIEHVTTAQYAALTTPSPTTLYVVTD